MNTFKPATHAATEATKRNWNRVEDKDFGALKTASENFTYAGHYGWRVFDMVRVVDYTDSKGNPARSINVYRNLDIADNEHAEVTASDYRDHAHLDGITVKAEARANRREESVAMNLSTAQARALRDQLNAMDLDEEEGN